MLINVRKMIVLKEKKGVLMIQKIYFVVMFKIQKKRTDERLSAL